MSLPQATLSSGFPSILSKCIDHLVGEIWLRAPGRIRAGNLRGHFHLYFDLSFRSFIRSVIGKGRPRAVETALAEPPSMAGIPWQAAAMRHLAPLESLKRLPHGAIFCLHAGKEGISLPRFGGAGQHGLGGLPCGAAREEKNSQQ
jgi:hypothetical protein